MKKWMKLGLVVMSTVTLMASLALVGCGGAQNSDSSAASSDVSSENVPTDEPAVNATSIISDTTNMESVSMNVKDGVSDADAQAFADKIAQVDGVSEVKYFNADEARECGHDSAFIEYAFSDDKNGKDITNNVLNSDGMADVIEPEYEQGTFVSAATGEEESGTYMLVKRSHTTDIGVFTESIDYILVDEDEQERE